ncbi:MAG TPA: hypothetical protein VJ722_09070, partial [Rhodanobacteraceae bacterium]|nr:hypothetical protein [Rhodanobacteraceae bacterium]
MKPLSLVCGLALGLVLAASAPATLAQESGAAPVAATSATAPKLHAAMRSLWHGHIVHARAYAMA